MREIWKPCADGYYVVSNRGRVRRVGADNRGHDRKRPILKPFNDRYGRPTVTLCVKDGMRRRRRVHQLVAEAFLGPRPAGKEVNHINGIKADNRLENIEYLTHRENCAHAYRNGLMPSRVGSGNPNAILSDPQVRAIRSRQGLGIPGTVVARQFSVSPEAVRAIWRRDNWRHL